jgi:hypothetical protein
MVAVRSVGGSGAVICCRVVPSTMLEKSLDPPALFAVIAYAKVVFGGRFESVKRGFIICPIMDTFSGGRTFATFENIQSFDALYTVYDVAPDIEFQTIRIDEDESPVVVMPDGGSGAAEPPGDPVELALGVNGPPPLGIVVPVTSTTKQ